MPRLRQLSGRQVIRFLMTFGFEVTRQRGSHVHLERREGKARYRIVVPLHKQLVRKTLSEIYRQAAQSIDEENLRSAFYG